MVRKLRIGGNAPHPLREILNILPGPHVDHVADANDLSMFVDGTFAAVYASRIAEHLD
jgi:predicted SAM-dependent methyltransferase